MESAPAAAKASSWRSGRSIIRWTSRTPPALCTWSRRASTMSAPIVIGGTKWPSITSTWITRAPASMTSRTWSPRRAKSAERIDGATRVSDMSSAPIGGRLSPERGATMGALSVLVLVSDSRPSKGELLALLAVVPRGLFLFLHRVVLVARRSPLNVLTIGSHDVLEVGDHRVIAGAAIDDVLLAVADMERVVALLTVQGVALRVVGAVHVAAGERPQVVVALAAERLVDSEIG